MMTLDINPTHFSSDDMLHELITQSLNKIIGKPHQIITSKLPFASGHSILALDCDQKVLLIVYDQHNGGQALLNGLEILESLETHRAWIFQLYPALFNNDRQALHCDDIELFVLAPTVPPGGDYLYQHFKQLHISTFQPLLINDEIGLLIEPVATATSRLAPQLATKIPVELSTATSTEAATETAVAFRTGILSLEKAEEDYFQKLNISG